LSNLLFKLTQKQLTRDELVKLSKIVVFIQNEDPNKLVANEIFKIDNLENKIGFKLGCEEKESQILENVSVTTFNFFNGTDKITNNLQIHQLKFIL